MEDLERAQARKIAAEADLLELEVASRGGRLATPATVAVIERLSSATIALNSALEAAEAAGLHGRIEIAPEGTLRVALRLPIG